MTTGKRASDLVYHVVGSMSGTSLDGLDLALCRFEWHDSGWKYFIRKAMTVPYSPEWYDALKNSVNLSEDELTRLDQRFGTYIGECVSKFCDHTAVKPDFVSSHGHTVRHDPARGITLQIGDGKTISDACGYPVINDFRTADVALGGQGAPLVPIGDLMLFKEFPVCLNLGGIANVSVKSASGIAAYDVAPCNLVLNHFARQLDMPYDRHGWAARRGKLINGLFESWNKLEYYQRKAPKSLDASFVPLTILPVTQRFSPSPEDGLRTWCEHLAFQLSHHCGGAGGAVLVTGGGAHNAFFTELAMTKYGLPFVLPDKQLIDFKEALIFAFMAVLRFRREVNCLSSVTGAKRDHCVGEMIGFGDHLSSFDRR